MNFFKDLNSLYSAMNSFQEVIIFPLGVEGQNLIELIRYMNATYRITCIAVPKLPNENARQLVHTIPTIQLNNLPHFRETAIFIVAVPSDQNQAAYEYLVQFGCKNVGVISDNVHMQITDSLKNFFSSGQSANYFFNYFYDKFTEMRYRLDEQNEVCSLNSKTFEPFRNKFRNKKIVIFATGPSADYYDPISDAIHIGLNFAWKRKNIRLNYLFTNDGGEKESMSAMEKGFSLIKDGIFVSKFMDRIPYCYSNYPEDVSLRFKNVRRFYIDDSVDNPIYQDICYHPLSCCGSVVFAALHFSLFTYPKQIYIVGCDAQKSNYGHFYEKISDDVFPCLDKIKVTWSRMKMFANQYYPETEIISVNPVGLKGLFKDIYTQKFKDMNNNKGGGYRQLEILACKFSCEKNIAVTPFDLKEAA